MSSFGTALAAAAGLLALLGCSDGPVEYGALKGHVTIGPLVPVVHEGEPEPVPSPEDYAARKVLVFHRGGRREFARIDIDAGGNYGSPLPAGAWVVDINRTGIDSAAGLPAEIEIRAGEVTRLDIDIDTGIR